MMRRGRKTPRLGGEFYRGRGWFFVTVCCEGRRAFFADPALAQWFIGRLRDCAAMHRVRVHAFCVMPDHVHLLLEGGEEGCDLLAFMARLKQRTAYEARRLVGSRLWQRSFYDHVLRAAESLSAVAWYIWVNPVRKGLCGRAEDYPFSGSFTLDWKHSRQPSQPWKPPWK